MLYKRMLQIHGIKLSKIYVPLFKTIFFNQPMYYNKLICLIHLRCIAKILLKSREK